MKEKLIKLMNKFSRSMTGIVMFLAIMGTVIALATIMKLEFMPEPIVAFGGLISSMMDAMLNNLSLIFCVGLTTTMAKNKKVDAALVATISYLMFLAVNNAWLTSQGMLAEPGEMGLFGTGQAIVLGFQVSDMGVFLGMILGCITAFVFNKFANVEFSDMFKIYGGSRLAFAVMIPVVLVLGVGVTYIWPTVNDGIAATTEFMKDAGPGGVFAYAFGNRFLIPTGLHHMFLAVDFQLMGSSLKGTYLWPIVAISNICQGSAAFGAWLIYKRRKMAKEEGLALTSGVSAFLGVTEPAMFGVNLPLKVPFFAAICTSGILGAVIGANRVLGNVGVGGVPAFISIQSKY